MKTKIFKSLKELNKYYNMETNTYIFKEGENWFNVDIRFCLEIESNINACDIKARDIKARDIKACNINACDINACDIKARDIKACDINACDINAWDINACDINACDINAWDIKAHDINACDINAWDINACDINACDIVFYAICIAKNTLICKSITGVRDNAKYLCLDSEPIIERAKEKEDNK